MASVEKPPKKGELAEIEPSSPGELAEGRALGIVSIEIDGDRRDLDRLCGVKDGCRLVGHGRRDGNNRNRAECHRNRVTPNPL